MYQPSLYVSEVYVHESAVHILYIFQLKFLAKTLANHAKLSLFANRSNSR